MGPEVSRPTTPADHLGPARSVLSLLAWLALSLAVAAMGGLFLPGPEAAGSNSDIGQSARMTPGGS